jgi:DNA-binding beta-propeller fold protein YncE
MIMKIANRRVTSLVFLIVLMSAVIAWHVGSFEHEDLIGAAAAASPKESGTLPLKLVADIELPGPTNRFDYQSYDPRTHLLFIAHLAAGTVVVFNTESNQVVAEIPGISQVHGVLAVPGLNRVYASATGTNEIVAIDEKSLKEVARIPGGVYPDGMTYAPEVHKLYVSDQSGKTETIIDTLTNQRIKTISLGGEAGNSQYDPVSKHVFVNVQTRGELAEIDTHSDTVVARYPLSGAGRNHGLLIEPSLRLAFIACEDNAKLLVVDMKSMKVVSSESVGKDPDVLAFDEALHLLYVASESGIVSIFKEQGRTLNKIAEGHLADKAHSVAVDQQTHRVYFPIQNLKGRAVLRIVEPIAKH